MIKCFEAQILNLEVVPQTMQHHAMAGMKNKLRKQQNILVMTGWHHCYRKCYFYAMGLTAKTSKKESLVIKIKLQKEMLSLLPPFHIFLKCLEILFQLNLWLFPAMEKQKHIRDISLQY